MQSCFGSTGFGLASYRGVEERVVSAVSSIHCSRRFWMSFVPPDLFASAYIALHGGLVSWY